MGEEEKERNGGNDNRKGKRLRNLKDGSGERKERKGGKERRKRKRLRKF